MAMATSITWEQHFSQPTVDYVKRTDQEIEEAKQQSRKPNVTDFDLMVAEWVKSANLQAPTPTNYHIIATPLFEVSSICIRRDNEQLDDVNSSFEIYGHVKLTNHLGKEFLMFNRAEDNPKTLFMLDSTSAILHKSQLGSARWLPQNFWLELFLVDKSRNITIFKDEFLLDFTRNVIYDEEQVAFHQSGDGDGAYGRVSVHYTVFRWALLALVRLTVSKTANDSLTDGKDGSDVVVVSGTISTSTKSKGGRFELLRVLFDEESLPLTVNDPAQLPLLAVPVSSSFRINASLLVNGEYISSGDDGLEFEPTDVSAVPFRKEIMGQGWCVQVSVSWRHAYQVFGADESVKVVNFDDSESEVASSEENEEELSKSEESEKESYQVFGADESDKVVNFDDSESEVASSEENEEEPSKSEESEKESSKSEESEKESSKSEESEKESSENEESTKGEDVSGREKNSIEKRKILSHRQLLEIFSISVCSLDDDCGSLGLYGTIIYKNLLWNHVLYKRDKEDLDIVYPHKPLLQLKLPPCRDIEEGYFEMHFDLKDGKGREMSKGYLRWSYRVDWGDDRICSIVPGEQGFACVHYAIFSNAFAAKVKLILHTLLSPYCYVSGKVNARYSTQRYSNQYERKYYQSTLFREANKSVDLESNASESSHWIAIELPLLKDEVAVPSDTPLIIKAELQVRTVYSVDLLIGEATFDPRRPYVPCSKMIHGTGIHGTRFARSVLQMEVQWIDS